jgi:acetyltransferase-like isoleucine patch superfamily enzyme
MHLHGRETAIRRNGCSDHQYPAGVAIHGNVEIGKGVSICEPAEINGTGSSVTIGDGCDIAAFVTINVADSSRKCIGFSDDVERQEIVLEDHVFVGTGAIILGGCSIGHHSIVGAGVVLRKRTRVPPRWKVYRPEDYVSESNE